MNELAEITLELKEKINTIRKNFSHETASHAFASLFIWRKDMGLKVLFEEDFFVVRSELFGENTWFFPCGESSKIIKFIENVPKENLKFIYVREEDLKFLDGFEILEIENDFEYVYDSTEQVELVGRKFNKLRNKLHQVERVGELDFVEINDSNIDIAIQICEKSPESIPTADGLQDKFAVDFMLGNFKELGVVGTITYLDGNPCSVTAGYPLSDSVFDMSLSKETERISGLSVYSKKSLISILKDKYSRINAEEDLGIPGIRQLKEIMRPIYKIKMYSGEFING